MKSILGKKKKKHVNSPRLKQEHLQHVVVYSLLALGVLGIWFHDSVTVENIEGTLDTFDKIVARITASIKELTTLGIVVGGLIYAWLQIFRKP